MPNLNTCATFHHPSLKYIEIRDHWPLLHTGNKQSTFEARDDHHASMPQKSLETTKC
uniref:Uncharacterized protein n=1 Tax=Arion vulgaris TaxID=1028688 RepID=A0A0B7A4L2_9EUPU